MSGMSSIAAAVGKLGATFAGRLLQPTDGGYEEARKVHNGLVDKRPALIARCRGVADIVDAVHLARKLDLEVAVRGGGHNVAGRATIDGGLMIDLSPMKGIHVDPKARTARAQGGVTWGEFNRETQLHGLATTGGVVSTTGIAGLTLGRRTGLADGQVRPRPRQSPLGRPRHRRRPGCSRRARTNNADLFWAVRGGGGNFGVAASFEYRLHPVGPTITGGLVAYPFERGPGRAAVLPRRHRVAARRVHGVRGPDPCPRRLGRQAGGDGGVSLRPAATPARRPCGRSRRSARRRMDAIGPMPYCQLNAMLDAAYPRGALNYWKSSFLAQLSDEAIDTMIECFAGARRRWARCSSSTSTARRPGSASATPPFPHARRATTSSCCRNGWTRRTTSACIAWARETYAAMQPFMASGRYVNYLDDDETGDPVAAAYGPTTGDSSRSRPSTIRRTSST